MYVRGCGCASVSVFSCSWYSFLRRQEAKRAGESVGDEFFRGIDEEKQGYVKAGGKLLKETTNSCLNKSKQNPESTITDNVCLHISENSSSFFCKFPAPNKV